MAASSPDLKQGPQGKPRNTSNKSTNYLKLLNINCKSVVNKKDTFQNIVNSTLPDVIVATETWLTGEIKDGEIGQAANFAEEYIYRQDRSSLGGGVLIAVLNSYKSHRVTKLDSCIRKVNNYGFV